MPLVGIMSISELFSDDAVDDDFCPIDFKAELNEDQYRAVTSPPGPALVLAGAGSGKTRTLTYRVAWLLSQGVSAEAILLLTFTNKAAKEMLGRVQELTGVGSHQLWGGTFHSIGQRVLRMFGEPIGLGPNYTILDEGESESLIGDIVRGLDKDFFKNKGNPKAKVLGNMISYARNTQAPVGDALQEKYHEYSSLVDKVADFSRVYAKRKLELQVADYDDLLELWLLLMRKSVEVSNWVHNRFQHVLVDEYQDTNTLQSAIIDHVGANHQIMAVGDDAQCIYTWRGANFENIMSFPDRHPGTELHKIVLNYRSTPDILDLANGVLENRPDNSGYQKDLEAVRACMSKPVMVPAMSTDQQAQYICRKIVELHRQEGYDLSDIAILYRAHYQSMELQMELSRGHVPFQITSGVRFFEQAHMKDIAAQLRFASNPGDSLAFQRMTCLLPKIGPKGAEKILATAHTVMQDENVDIFAALSAPVVLKKVAADAREEWPDLVETLTNLRQSMSEDSPEHVVRTAVEGWYSGFIRQLYDNWENRMDDLESLIGFATKYTDTTEMLSQLVLLNSETSSRSISTDEDAVRLSTVHQAKGLEYPVVFVIGLADGAFPLQRAIEAGDVEEERRLFYVAVTRAQDELYLTYPTVVMIRGGRMPARPSQFLRELDDDTYEVQRIPGMHQSYERGRERFANRGNSW